MAIDFRRSLGRWWWWSWAAAAFIAVGLTPRVGVADPFPEPAELAPAVRFWSATFTQYGHRDVVIHDRVTLGLVYEVVSDVSGEDDPRVRAAVGRAVEGLLPAVPAT